MNRRSSTILWGQMKKKKERKSNFNYSEEFEALMEGGDGWVEENVQDVEFHDWEDDDDDDDDDGGQSPPPSDNDNDNNRRLVIQIESHATCPTPECDFKLQNTVQSFPGVSINKLSIERSSLDIHTIKELPQDILNKMVFDDSTRLVHIHNKDISCDTDRNNTDKIVSKFDVKQFCDYFRNFHSQVPTFCDGKWGNLYAKALHSIVRIVIGSQGDDGFESCGTGCIISKSPNFALIISCGHIFDDLSSTTNGNGDPRVRVITSEFVVHEASVQYRPSNLDFCVLRIEGNLSEYLEALELKVDPPNYGQEVFAISVPYHRMIIPERLREDPEFSLLVNAIWFPISLGRVAHPKVVGFEKDNLAGSCVYLQMDALDSGSSGTTIIDEQLCVVAVFLSTTSTGGVVTGTWALRLDFVQHHLQKEFTKVADGNLKSILEQLFSPRGEQNGS